MKNASPYCGCLVALVTPFKASSKVLAIDYDAYGALIENTIAGGVNGIVPCGCTGEAATLSHKEQIEAIRFAVKIANGRVAVVGGVGSNCTRTAVELTKAGFKAGMDAALHITPYYNKPVQAGLYQHYSEIAKLGGPLFLYNVTSRTMVNLEPETVIALRRDFPNIIGIKQSSPDLGQYSRILSGCDDEFVVLCGDDSMVIAAMALGAKGLVSVAANDFPEEFSRLCALMAENDLPSARKIHFRFQGFCKAIFIDTNPIGIKYSLSLKGKIDNALRLPLTPAQPSTEQIIEQELELLAS